MSASPFDREVCLRCGEIRPIEDFFSDGVAWAERGADDPIVCSTCRAAPPPEPAPEPSPNVETAVAISDDTAAAWAQLTPKVRRLFRLMFNNPGMKYADAARQVGMPTHYGLQKVFATQTAARLVFQRLLSDAGIDYAYMVQKLRLALHAQKAQWNPATKAWDYFPDWNAQLRALSMAMASHDQGQSARPEREGSTTVIVMTHNLDGPAPPRTGAGLVARARIIDAEAERVDE